MLRNWADAIASIESAGSGGYSAVGPMTKKGNRAYGRYQVMDFNIGPWTEKHLGRRLTPQEFLADQAAQDAVFNGEFGSYVKKHGNPEDAASIWFTGRPAAQGANSKDILGTSGAGYVAKFKRAMGNTSLIGGEENDTLGAAPMQFQQEEEQRGLLGGLLGPKAREFLTPERVAALQMALEGMTLNPNKGVMLAAQNRIENSREQRGRNRTAQWLADQGRGDLAQAVATGTIDGRTALGIMREDAQGAEPVKGVEVNGQLVNPITGDVIGDYRDAGGGMDKDALTAANAIRDDARTDLDPYELSRSGFEAVQTFFNNPGGVSDYALTVAFAKILDPTSVVREGEQAAVAKSGAISGALKSQLTNALNGTGQLPPKVREEIARLSTEIYNKRAVGAQETYGRYGDLAERAGLQRGDAYMGEEPYFYEGQPRGGPVRPQARPGQPQGQASASGQGITQEMIRQAVDSLTEYERELMNSIPGDKAKLRYLQSIGKLP